MCVQILNLTTPEVKEFLSVSVAAVESLPLEWEWEDFVVFARCAHIDRVNSSLKPG